MQYKAFLALAAAFANCSSAQQSKSAADVAKSLDSISQTITEAVALIEAAPTSTGDLTDAEKVQPSVTFTTRKGYFHERD